MKPAIERSGTVTDGGNKPAVEAAVNAKLAALQKGLYRWILEEGNGKAGNLASGSLQLAAARLTGASELISDYIELGLAPALRDDDVLRGFVFGSGRLLDQRPGENRIAQIYTNAVSQPPVADPLSTIAPTINSRAGAAQAAVQHLIEPTGAARLDETNPLVAATMDRQRRRRDCRRHAMKAHSGGVHTVVRRTKNSPTRVTGGAR